MLAALIDRACAQSPHSVCALLQDTALADCLKTGARLTVGDQSRNPPTLFPRQPLQRRMRIEFPDFRTEGPITTLDPQDAGTSELKDFVWLLRKRPASSALGDCDILRCEEQHKLRSVTPDLGPVMFRR